jgi:hypothetical protein
VTHAAEELIARVPQSRPIISTAVTRDETVGSAAIVMIERMHDSSHVKLAEIEGLRAVAVILVASMSSSSCPDS